MSAPEQTPMPRPGPEHARLGEHVGEWDVDCTFFMGPDQPPMPVKAKETVEMFGAFFTTGRFRAEMFGSPFEGRATLGYDPVAGRYVSTWCDTMTPFLYTFTGGFDASGKVLAMSGDGVDCSTGGPATYRTTEEHRPDGSRVFEMFMTPRGGSEMKLFTHVYTRAG
jgi:hypothetical protein